VKKPTAPEVQHVKTHGAEGTRYSDEKVRRALWTVAWESANLTYGEDLGFYGTADRVHGTLYKDGVAASRFKSDTADIQKDTNILTLKGHVSVERLEPEGRTGHKDGASSKESRAEGRMFCETLVWYPERGLGEAKGKVRFETDDYTMGPFDTLLFSPELKAGGTPQMFGERYGKRP
jgi:hypothetical protein